MRMMVMICGVCVRGSVDKVRYLRVDRRRHGYEDRGEVSSQCLTPLATSAWTVEGEPSYNRHDLVPVFGLCSQNNIIFHCIPEQNETSGCQ